MATIAEALRELVAQLSPGGSLALPLRLSGVIKIVEGDVRVWEEVSHGYAVAYHRLALSTLPEEALIFEKPVDMVVHGVAFQWPAGIPFPAKIAIYVKVTYDPVPRLSVVAPISWVDSLTKSPLILPFYLGGGHGLPEVN